MGERSRRPTRAHSCDSPARKGSVASGHALSQAFYRSFTGDPYPLSEAGSVPGTTSRTGTSSARASLAATLIAVDPAVVERGDEHEVASFRTRPRVTARWWGQGSRPNTSALPPSSRCRARRRGGGDPPLARTQHGGRGGEHRPGRTLACLCRAA